MTWHPNIPEEYRNQIVTGDARELAKRIPDESIDLIFTDPVYDRIEDYEWLAETAVRLLMHGGNVVVQTGKIDLPEVLPAMNIPGLEWVTLLAEVHPRASGMIGKRNIQTGWTPYLWFCKGYPRNGQWVFDRYYAKGKDRSFHRWGDGSSFYQMYIERLSGPEDLILDPFTGGGTVPAVCKILSRNYIAFEIDPDIAEMARERVLNTQPPLFVPEPEQLEMIE